MLNSFKIYFHMVLFVVSSQPSLKKKKSKFKAHHRLAVKADQSKTYMAAPMRTPSTEGVKRGHDPIAYSIINFYIAPKRTSSTEGVKRGHDPISYSIINLYSSQENLLH